MSQGVVPCHLYKQSVLTASEVTTLWRYRSFIIIIIISIIIIIFFTLSRYIPEGV